jgi:hypothetical protein
MDKNTDEKKRERQNNYNDNNHAYFIFYRGEELAPLPTVTSREVWNSISASLQVIA